MHNCASAAASVAIEHTLTLSQVEVDLHDGMELFLEGEREKMTRDAFFIAHTPLPSLSSRFVFILPTQARVSHLHFAKVLLGFHVQVSIAAVQAKEKETRARKTLHGFMNCLFHIPQLLDHALL